MDLNLAQKLIKYNPTDVQTVTYVVEYAQHNYEGDAVQTYINERLTGKTQREIAEIAQLIPLFRIEDLELYPTLHLHMAHPSLP